MLGPFQTIEAIELYTYHTCIQLHLYLKFASIQAVELCNLCAKNPSNKLPPHQGKFEREADGTWLGEYFTCRGETGVWRVQSVNTQLAASCRNLGCFFRGCAYIMPCPLYFLLHELPANHLILVPALEIR
jgi:hypothetical protein